MKPTPPKDATRIWRIETPQDAQGQRLDGFLGKALAGQGLSRERIKAWIKNGSLLLDGTACTKPSTLLHGGERLELTGLPADSPLAPERGELSVLYEDEHLLVLDKPAGLTVHPAPGLEHGTLVHRLLHRYPEMAAMEGERPGIVHRIDKDTSGLLLVARTEAARLPLAEAFAQRSIDKEYLALVHGTPADTQGEITEPIGRHPAHKTRMSVLDKGGRPAHSRWRVLLASGKGRGAWSLLAVRIHTGRTHQIRVHLSHMGHPIVGDALYGSTPALRPPQCPEKTYSLLASRQMLHAWRLGFEHPVTGARLDFMRPPPADFLQLALCLQRRVQRVVVTGLPGSGKSSLARQMHKSGAPLFSADKAVAELYSPGHEGWSWLFQRHGERYLQESDLPMEQRPVDKKALFADMQRDPALRRKVEAALHPLVFQRLQAFWDEHQRKRLALAEIPLLFETAGQSAEAVRETADVIVGVYCPRKTRLARLQHSRGWSEEALAAMDSWQWSQEAKLNACDMVVDNSGDETDLQRHAAGLLQELRMLRARRMHGIAEFLQRLWSETSE